jgi:hypothetical protein
MALVVQRRHRPEASAGTTPARTMRAMDLAGHAADGLPATCADPGCVAAVDRGDRWVGPHCSVEEGGRAHFHHRDRLYASVRERRAAAFAELCARLDRDPVDFVTAWTYLRDHPIFNRPRLPAHLDVNVDELDDEALTSVRAPQWLEDSNGLQAMWIHVSRGADGIVVELEHGPHLWFDDVTLEDWTHFPASGQPTHDPRLDVRAGSYEDAIIELAARVRAAYGDDRSRVRDRFAGSAAGSDCSR